MVKNIQTVKFAKDANLRLFTVHVKEDGTLEFTS